ncbi:diguanylate cyclase [Magnetovibrio sp.]|uniref:diguanylate cyclase n=1 Tax=Magnetovibrio sp. TaxID=2024836 RepID=UPI002F925DC2
MANEPATMEEKLAELRAQYALKIADRVDELQVHVDDLKRTEDNAHNDRLKKLRDGAHKLAGSGATFGFPGVTHYARKIEQMCVKTLEQGLPVSVELIAKLNVLCEQLRQSAQEDEQQDVDPKPASYRPEIPDLHNSSRQKVLFIMEYDGPTAMQILLEMDHFGFDARIIDHPAKLLDDLRSNGAVDVIVTGLAFDGDDEAALKVLAELRQQADYKATPVVVHTTVDTMSARLGAVRVGVKAYLIKPIDMADLVDILDHVTMRHEDEPFRVLVVDDDESLATHTELVLQGAGMDAQKTTDPQKIFEILDDFSPELILLDLYMPGCDGQDIAAVIRQREEYAGIPIVFLSGEADKTKQLSAMEMGGDDFLTKPIKASHLISSVRIRAGRFRQLRSFMVRDSMTGLFNHTTTKQMLDTEIARVRRSGAELALASLDIDHFKNVNDTYGHAVGDRVIKSLARMLRQRLRSADVIGRMGGEEFAAILPESGLEEAARVFDQIRKAFSEIVFHTDGTQFNVTISCGVASFADHNTATSLSDAADKALYAAKHGGRNQVVKAD